MTASWQLLPRLEALSLRLTLALALALPTIAQAQAQATGALQNATDAPLQATLENGLRVVAQRASGSAAAALCISYRTGSRDEGSGQLGLARLVEELMTQGSRNLGSDDGLRLISERGGQTESSTTTDLTQFCTLLPENALALALWVEADRMKNLSVTADGFARQRDLLVMQQSTRSSSESYSAGLQRLTQLAYQDYAAYQSNTLGATNDLAGLTLQHAQDFHWRYYTPSNAVVSIVSSDPSQALSWVTKYFTTVIDRATAPAAPVPRPEQRQSSERLSVLSDDNCTTPAVYYGYRVGPVGNDDYVAMQLIAHILGGSDGARLPQSLIVERGSALHTSVRLLGNPALDLLAIHVAVAPLSNVDKVQEVVDAELKRLRFFGPSVQELDRAKRQFSAERVRNQTSTLELAQQLGRRQALGSPLDSSNEQAALQAITPDQIRRVAQLYLQDHKRSIVEIYPPGWPQDAAPLVVVLKHTVKRGENLETIARRYGSSVSEIARVSGIDVKRAIQPGQVLKVPVVGGKQPSAPPAMRSHKVRAGDSLSLLAKIYGTSVAEIVRLNALDRNKPIMVGQKLSIPPRGSAEPSPAPNPSKPAAVTPPKTEAPPAKNSSTPTNKKK